MPKVSHILTVNYFMMAISKQFKKYHDDVVARINSTSLAIPAQRRAFKQGFSFSKEPFESQLEIWDHIWKQSNSFRARVHAYFFLEQYVNKKDFHDQLWKTSSSWQEEIDDWPLCDGLAKINSKILVSYPVEVYAVLARWNKHKDLWKRRQSVVSLLYFSRTKKEYLPFSKIAAHVTPLLADKEYYVQKGVGWTLREMYTVYPKETMPFLQKHIKDISAIAFTIAIEKMSDAEKNKLKALRKQKTQIPNN